MKHTLIAALIMLGALPGVVFAGPVIRSGESVTVSADQMLEADFYALGNSVSVSGEAEGDVYVLGSSITLNAPVAGDVAALGGSVRVHGEVGDDVRIVGGQVEIAEPIVGDLVVLGGSLTILSTARVDGDVIFMSGDADISGPVSGSILGTADQLRIDAEVKGDVRVRAFSKLTLGDRANIGGNVYYTSLEELTRAQGAVIEGDIKRGAVVMPDNKDVLRGFLMQTLIMLFAALSAFLMVRPLVERLVAASTYSYGIHGLVGILVLFATPFVGVLLLVSVLGSVVGAIVLASYLVLLIISWIVSGIVLGSFMERQLLKRNEVTLLTVVFGTIAYNALLLIPFIGLFVAVTCFFIVLGGIVVLGYRSVR